MPLFASRRSLDPDIKSSHTERQSLSALAGRQSRERCGLDYDTLLGRLPTFLLSARALRCKPLNFARFMALPRKRVAYDSGVKLRISESVALRFPSRGSKRASFVAGVIWFHGQTSWQMSQPYNQPSTCVDTSSRISVARDSMVACEMHRFESST